MKYHFITGRLMVDYFLPKRGCSTFVMARVTPPHHLIVTALATYQKGILEAFTKTSKQCGCNILESKLTSMGEECSLLFHFTGTWHTVAKLEAALPVLAQQFQAQLHTKRTLPRPTLSALPYHIQVIAQDRPGVLNDLVSFFTPQHISIEKMECETYRAKNDTPMTAISFLVNISPKQHLATLRDQFILYCEDRNFDAMIEPSK